MKLKLLFLFVMTFTTIWCSAQSQINLPVTFDDSTVNYAMTDFGGNISAVVADPTNPSNTVGQAEKTAAAAVWAGTTMGDPIGTGFATAIPFTANSTVITAMVWSPDAGTPIRLKVEDATNGAISVETEDTTTLAGAWEMLTFDFSNEMPSTPALNLANTYDKASIFFNFGTDGATAGAKTYYWDDVTFVPGALSQIDLPVTFDNPSVSYAMTDFGGNISAVVADPTNPSNTVGQAEKTAAAAVWAGTTMGDPIGTGFANAVPFTANSTVITAMVWSPDAGTPIRLKVEDATNGAISVETEDTTTLAGAWEMLTFDFSNEMPSTPALNLANTYDKASIFFNFGTDGATAGAKTYYWDDVTFVPGALSQIDLPVTFDNPSVSYAMTDFGGNISAVVADPTNPSNTVGQAEKTAAAAVWAGTTMGDPIGTGFATAIPFTANSTVITAMVWSPDAGTPIRLKVEDATNGAISVETEDTTTLAGAWEMLTFDFSNEMPSTPALNLANTYDKASIFFNFGTDGATAGAKTYYWDDVTFVPGALSQIDLPVTFDNPSVSYAMTDFGGNISAVVADPTNPSNTVGQAEKTAAAAVWAGTTMGDPIGTGFATAIPFTANSTVITAMVWSPDAGTPIRLKVEDATNGAISVETEDTTTLAGAWEMLTFDFSNEMPSTPALNLANTYDKASIFFNFGTDGATAGAKTYYWDDVMFVPDTTSGGGNTSPYCNTLVGHLGQGTGTTTDIFLTIKNTGATTMEVEIESATADTVDLLIVINGSGAAISPEDFSIPGKIKRTLTWTTPPANVDLNVLWSKGQFGGNWQLNPTDITIPFNAVCGSSPNPTLSQIDLPVNFDDTTVNYTMTDFGGNVSAVVVDPTNSANMVGQAEKTATAATWAGTTMGDTSGTGFANAIPFTATSTVITAMVWSPDAGTPIRLKVEDATNGAVSVETEDTTTLVGAWEMLTFDFANEAPGTAALNLANTYDKASIFFNFGTDGATAGAKTYYWDDVEFVTGGGNPLGQVDLPVTFEDSTVNYDLVDFGGNVSMIVVDPTNPSNTVGQSEKTDSAQTWAGTTMGLNGFANEIPFTASNTSISVMVWSPDAGTPIRLKAEDATNPTISVETEDTTTMAGAWEMLTFDFANEAPGTAALNLANTYDKASIFFNFGTDGATAGAKTYYWDNVEFVTGGGNPLSQIDLPVTFDVATVNYTMTDFGGNVSAVVVDPTNSSNMVGRAEKTDSAQTWAGTTMGDTSGTGFANAIPFSTGNTTITAMVWSPDAGTPIRLKVEDMNDPTISVETEDTTTMAGAWEMLTFDFSNEAPGTAAINLANTYDKASIFFNFGTDGITAGAKTYYWDDVEFAGGGSNPLSQIDLPVRFDDTTINHMMTDFGGNISSVVADPVNASNMVGQAIKTVSAQTWAGTTMGENNNGFANPIPFSSSETRMSVRVYSPDAGTPIRLKVEDNANPAISVETEELTTVANAWETLVFDFSNEAAGTPALDLNNVYDKAVIFFNFGTDGATAGEKTYHWDDVIFGITSGLSSSVFEDFKYYPNPAKDLVFFSTKSDIDEIQVFDILGSRVDGLSFDQNRKSLNISTMKSGAYMVKIRIDNSVETFKLIKE